MSSADATSDLISESSPSPFFVAGGTLTADAPSYVERKADRELQEALRAGEYCYVLDSRQVGKSSLLIRAPKIPLRASGICKNLSFASKTGASGPHSGL